MKKSKIVVLIAFALMIATLLCSCNGGVKKVKKASPEDIFSGEFEYTSKTLKESDELSFENAQVETSAGKFVVFKETPDSISDLIPDSENYSITTATYSVYNMEIDKVVATYEEKITVSTSGGKTTTTSTSFGEFATKEVNDYSVFVLIGKETKSQSAPEGAGVAQRDVTEMSVLYDQNGKEITRTQGVRRLSTTCDMFAFNNVYYRVNQDGTSYTKAFDADMKSVPDFDAYSENYYYVINNEDADSISAAHVYDKECNFVAVYSITKEAWWCNTEEMNGIGDPKIFVMQDGNLYGQYLLPLPEDSKKYDVTFGNQKYEFVTEIFDVESEKVKEIESDNYIDRLTGDTKNSIFGMYGVSIFTDKVVNVVMYVPIVDKRIAQSYAEMKFASMDNKGKIEFLISDSIENMLMPVANIAEDRIAFMSFSEQTFLAKTDGTVLGEISFNCDMNDEYIFTENKLYDFDLKVVYDFAAEGMKLYGHTAKSVFFEKNDKIYFYSSKLGLCELLKEEAEVTYEIHDTYFGGCKTEVKNGESKTTYYYYNAEGDLILESEYELTLVSSCESAVVLRGMKDGKTVYIRFGA